MTFVGIRAAALQCGRVCPARAKILTQLTSSSFKSAKMQVGDKVYYIIHKCIVRYGLSVLEHLVVLFQT